MGDLGVDTEVERVGEGRYRAKLSRDWEIWGPMGGYIAAVALRAAGAESRFDRPVSLACNYLSVAAFEDVDVDVTVLRAARHAESLRATVTQGGKPMLEALVWTAGDGAAAARLDHHIVDPPDVPDPADLPTFAERFGEDPPPPPFPFWLNFESRPLDFRKEWPPSEPLPPVWRQWHRFEPTPTLEDPWIDAARAVVLIDVQSWPAASRPHAWQLDQLRIYAPSLDLYVAFHESAADSEWLLTDGYSPTAGDGLVGWTGRLWSADRRLVASGGGQLLCRQMPAAQTK